MACAITNADNGIPKDLNIEVVATPPADGGRGLIRVSKNEIRHYSGDRKNIKYIVSKDNGKTWTDAQAPDSYPPNYGGIAKEAPAITWLPKHKQFIRVQPIKGYVFLTDNLDGQWKAVAKDGTLTSDWAQMTDDERKEKLVSLNGIMRSPLEVNDGKRIIIPAHGNGTFFHISDDGGKTWTKSKGNIHVPAPELHPRNKAKRWLNTGVEGTVVELKDGRLYCVVRTSHDQHWQAFSSDHGDTWTKPEKSPFFGTLTMITLGRLKDGRLISLWTDTAAMPEGKHGNKGGENAFTNRDSHHIAVSEDDGKTWIGFREIYLNPYRNDEKYSAGSDLGSHQSEFVELDNGKILISLGQNPRHRKIIIAPVDIAYQKTRTTDLVKDGLDAWTYHTFIPKPVGHCAYNRKPSATLTDEGMLIRFLDDDTLINEPEELDYRAGGATWNFPNAKTGTVTVQFKLQPGGKGIHLSLTDRLFNGCDMSTPEQAIYTIDAIPGKTFQPNKVYTMSFQWNGVEKGKSVCYVRVNGKPYKKLVAQEDSPVGLNYLHIISAATEPDEGAVIIRAKAQQK